MLEETETNLVSNSTKDHSLPKDLFTIEEVNQNWINLLNEIRLVNPTNYNGLKETQIEINQANNNILTFKFVSQLASLEFEEYKIEFLKNLKQKVNNYAIEIEFVIEENNTNGSKPITKIDITKELIKKNVLLEKLINDFDLDIH